MHKQCTRHASRQKAVQDSTRHVASVGFRLILGKRKSLAPPVVFTQLCYTSAHEHPTVVAVVLLRDGIWWEQGAVAK